MNIDGNFPTYERQTEILQKTDDIKAALPTIGKSKRTQTFTASGSWVAPTGVTQVFVTGGGGGGSGGAYSSTGASAPGNAGGATSFGTLLTISGGAGGGSGAASPLHTAPGAAGGPGGEAGTVGGVSGTGGSGAVAYLQGRGGSSGPYKGGVYSFDISYNLQRNGGYCSGGAPTLSVNGAAGGGGGGDFVYDRELTVVPGQSYTITIGAGGVSANSGGTLSGRGGNGILIIEWWE